MWKSWWGDQGGPDFLLETKARNACGSESVFLQKVLRLQWIASFWNEQENMVKRYGMPSPKSPWYSLGMMQRRHLATQATHKHMFPSTEDGKGTKIRQMLDQQEKRVSLAKLSPVMTLLVVLLSRQLLVAILPSIRRFSQAFWMASSCL